MERIYQLEERRSNERKTSKERSGSRKLNKYNSIDLIPKNSLKYQFSQKLLNGPYHTKDQERSWIQQTKYKISDFKTEVGMIVNFEIFNKIL